MAVITMTAPAYGSPDGLHVRLYALGELYTQDGPDGMMPSRLATAFVSMGVATTGGTTVSGAQQTINFGMQASMLGGQYDGGYDTVPPNV